MQLITAGKLEKVSPDLCRKAIRYFGKHLLSKRLFDNVTVRLVFTDEIKIKADCYQNAKHSFTIRVRNNMGHRQTLLSIAHEMVHVKQWSTGEMKEYIRFPNKCKWHGERYNADDKEYWLNHPWEIEAYGREIGLYKTFMKEPQYALCRQ